MFFPERVKAVHPPDRVLEVGPGSTPHPFSQFFLEKCFPESQAVGQRGGLPPIEFHKPITYFDGGRFPFEDKEFDYVICSHVLEHVPDVDLFVGELTRVASRGYLEFPTIHYEYLYNFDEHLNLLCYRDGEVLWMPKSETRLNDFTLVQDFLRSTLRAGHDDVIQSLKESFFQGFEWTAPLVIRRVNEVGLLVPPGDEVGMKKPLSGGELIRELADRLARRIGIGGD